MCITQPAPTNTELVIRVPTPAPRIQYNEIIPEDYRLIINPYIEPSLSQIMDNNRSFFPFFPGTIVGNLVFVLRDYTQNLERISNVEMIDETDSDDDDDDDREQEKEIVEESSSDSDDVHCQRRADNRQQPMTFDEEIRYFLRDAFISIPITVATATVEEIKSGEEE